MKILCKAYLVLAIIQVQSASHRLLHKILKGRFQYINQSEAKTRILMLLYYKEDLTISKKNKTETINVRYIYC